MNPTTIFVCATILTLLTPSFAAAAEGDPFTADGTGTGTAQACRPPLVLELGDCASREARGTLTGTLAACVPENKDLSSFTCYIHWTLALSSTGALWGCVQAEASVVPYLLGCTNLPGETYEAVSQPINVTYTGVPWGPSEEVEWVRACVDPGAPGVQRCSDAEPVHFIINIQNANAALGLPQQIDQASEILANIAARPPDPLGV